MGSEYDEVAKAIAKNVPRRKLLKILAGGVVAAVGGSVVGGAASARTSRVPYYEYSWECIPEVNQAQASADLIVSSEDEEECQLFVTDWRGRTWGTNIFRRSPFGVNGSFST